MRRVGLLVAIVLSAGLWAATAGAATTPDTEPLPPAPTSVDRAPQCPPPAPAPSLGAVAGGTVVTFTITAAGCA